jgi:molybdopterin-guanine dinucleotide biosynthesis protein A
MLELSIAILAGGKGSRIGTEKAFLRVNDVPLIKLIYDRLSPLSDDIMVIIGNKSAEEFKNLLPVSAKILNDFYYTMSPVGGFITAALSATKPYFAAVAVDMPLINPKIIEKLYFMAQGHSAAIPVLKDGTLEVLCAVYSSEAIKKQKADSVRSLKELAKRLPDPLFIDVDSLRDIDSELESFFNVNTKEDFSALLEKLKSL